MSDLCSSASCANLQAPRHTYDCCLALLSAGLFVYRRPASGGWRTEGDEPPDADAMEVEPAGQPNSGLRMKQEPEGNVTTERAVGSGVRFTSFRTLTYHEAVGEGLTAPG